MLTRVSAHIPNVTMCLCHFFVNKIHNSAFQQTLVLITKKYLTLYYQKFLILLNSACSATIYRYTYTVNIGSCRGS